METRLAQRSGTRSGMALGTLLAMLWGMRWGMVSGMLLARWSESLLDRPSDVWWGMRSDT